MKRMLPFSLLIVLLVLENCSFTPTFHYADYSDLVFLSPSGDDPSRCHLPEHYVPDTNHLDHLPVKHIRVNVHFMNSADSSANFTQPEADSVARWIIHYANVGLKRNGKMFLPLGNDTPVLPVRYRYRLTGRPGVANDTGVYCHFDDSLYYYVHKGPDKNLYDRRVIRRYGVQLDTVLNIFLMPNRTEGGAPPKPTMPVGVALGKAIKIGGIGPAPHPHWDYKGVINHEVGHIYGLRHSWRTRDGCDDTPPNPNCWNFTHDGSECDSLVSNNLMDYNARQEAITPCQIGTVQSQMARLTSRGRRYLAPRWCSLNPEKTIRIRDSTVWNGIRDLEGELVIEAGGYLRLRCRVSLPREARIIVAGGGTLVLDGCRLHNACGDQWDGILLQQTASKRGRLLVRQKPVIEHALHPVTWPATVP